MWSIYWIFHFIVQNTGLSLYLYELEGSFDRPLFVGDFGVSLLQALNHVQLMKALYVDLGLKEEFLPISNPKGLYFLYTVSLSKRGNLIHKHWFVSC